MMSDNTDKPDIADMLARTTFLSVGGALEQYFNEFVAAAEMLRRDGDEFPKIDPCEMGAGKKVVERLAQLRQREREQPVHVDHSEAIRFKNHQREWGQFIARRGAVGEMLHYQRVDWLTLEYVGIERRMVADNGACDELGRPRPTWRADSEALGQGIAQLEAMSPSERQQIPQMINQRRLERRIEALEQWAKRVGDLLSGREKAA